ncbi:hypothetical protein LB505_007186 [Fusarium chuoi]|nr:hypothetical protein LB505_007186 [Fusarium chuoi]
MKALVLNTSLKRAIVEDVDRPNPGSHEILVNVRAIALNPVDELYVSILCPRESELRRSFNDQHVWLDCCSSSIWSAWLTISIFLDATSDVRKRYENH